MLIGVILRVKYLFNLFVIQYFSMLRNVKTQSNYATNPIKDSLQHQVSWSRSGFKGGWRGICSGAPTLGAQSFEYII